jgi:hypothetical protein
MASIKGNHSVIEKANEDLGYQAPDQVISEQDKEYNKMVTKNTANLMKRKDGEDPYCRNKEVNIGHQLRFGVKPEIYKTQMNSRAGSFAESFLEKTPTGQQES